MHIGQNTMEIVGYQKIGRSFDSTSGDPIGLPECGHCSLEKQQYTTASLLNNSTS
jgi:hypothetical protein